jgi:protein arginine kinase activator
MLCEKCNKNTASVRIETSVGGEKVFHYICQECASEMELQMDFSGFLNGFLGMLLSASSPEQSEKSDLRCKSCGLSFHQFQKMGRFGCAECYASFEPQTQAIIKSVQGGSLHNGKIPNRLSAEIEPVRRLESLKYSLQKAVEKEEFEEAAAIRDKIRQLTGTPKEGMQHGQMV